MARDFSFCPGLERCESGETTKDYNIIYTSDTTLETSTANYWTMMEETTLGLPKNMTDAPKVLAADEIERFENMIIYLNLIKELS